MATHFFQKISPYDPLSFCFPHHHQRASCDLEEVSSTADILILVFPHQFVDNVCDKLKACVKKGAKAVSLIKVSVHHFSVLFYHFTYYIPPCCCFCFFFLFFFPLLLSFHPSSSPSPHHSLPPSFHFFFFISSSSSFFLRLLFSISPSPPFLHYFFVSIPSSPSTSTTSHKSNPSTFLNPLGPPHISPPPPLPHYISYPTPITTHPLPSQGFNLCKEGKLSLISDVIASQLHMPCPVIMGANIADEVAMEMYSEATLGYFSLLFSLISLLILFHWYFIIIGIILLVFYEY